MGGAFCTLRELRSFLLGTVAHAARTAARTSTLGVHPQPGRRVSAAVSAELARGACEKERYRHMQSRRMVNQSGTCTLQCQRAPVQRTLTQGQSTLAPVNVADQGANL